MYDDIFATYYTLYRTEADVPNSQDDEYKIGIPLANVAIKRWANYDDTYWKELFTTAQDEQDGDLLVTAATDYACPTNMREPGGLIRLTDPLTGALQATIPIIEPQAAQFKTDLASYAYFTGNPNSGFTLHINPVNNGQLVGCYIDYIYYKKPTLVDSNGQGTLEMADTDYVVHSMLANRFRGSRNPFYQSAKTDAEDSLRSMQASNNSGTWADPWTIPDNTGTSWGQ